MLGMSSGVGEREDYPEFSMMMGWSGGRGKEREKKGQGEGRKGKGGERREIEGKN